MAEQTKVTRIKAKDGASSKASAASKPKTSSTKRTTPTASKAPKEAKKGLFSRISAYFKGAWEELKQVRWPNRKATWSLTLAVLLFTAFFVILILLLDLLFGYIFELIIT